MKLNIFFLTFLIALVTLASVDARLRLDRNVDQGARELSSKSKSGSKSKSDKSKSKSSKSKSKSSKSKSKSDKSKSKSSKSSRGVILGAEARSAAHAAATAESSGNQAAARIIALLNGGP